MHHKTGALPPLIETLFNAEMLFLPFGEGVGPLTKLSLLEREAGEIPVAARGFRAALARLSGRLPAGAHAHHVFPQKFAAQFLEKGINVNNPAFGAWWEASSHLANAARYQRQWEAFLATNPTREAILDFGRKIARFYGLEVHF